MSQSTGTNKVFCEFCGKEIPEERLEILPDTTTCVECSQTQPYSKAEVVGLNNESDEANRLNMEDYEELDTDLAIPSDEGW